jgi:hypothetical protein
MGIGEGGKKSAGERDGWMDDIASITIMADDEG